MTSSPERRLGLGMQRFQLHCYEQGGIGGEAELREVFAVEVQGNGFLEIGKGFIQRLSLGHDVDLHALGNVVIFSLADECLDCTLQLCHVAVFVGTLLDSILLI